MDRWVEDLRFAGRGVLVAAVLLAGGISGLDAQGLPPVPAEMGALGWLVGAWEGSGWIEEGGRRGEFRGTERVERRMGGRVLVVEGSFTADMGPERGEVPVHQALGVISWDGRAGHHVMRTYTARGGQGEAHEAAVSEGRIVWGYDDPRMGRVRYTLTRTGEGAWREVGHASSDGGETWHQFFEMELRRR
jgi:hypothetical protein